MLLFMNQFQYRMKNDACFDTPFFACGTYSKRRMTDARRQKI
jgi:hypothetical protein